MRIALLFVLVLAAVALTADAKFAATQGFSGKHGVTCESCHTPIAEGLDAPATARLAGLPQGWDYGRPLELTVLVDGGPLANPVPGQPQGGFDLETDLGTLGPGPGMQGLLRFPNPMEATYTADGTARRSWTVVWTPPGPEAAPRPARFWLAVVSANGNHLMGGPDSIGERGDRTAKLESSVDPSEETNSTWRAQPLPAPVFDAYRPGATYVTGRVAEFADGAVWRLDGGPWIGAAGSPSFLIQLPSLAPGPHELEAVTVWMERESEPALVVLDGMDVSPAVQSAAPAPALGSVFVFLALFLVMVLRGVRR